jgi:hypothetical protein
MLGMAACLISRMLPKSLAEGRYSQQRPGQDSIGAFSGIRAFQDLMHVDGRASE